MKLQYLQSAEGEERIYLGIQGSVHTYLFPREGGVPDWQIHIHDRDKDDKKTWELRNDVHRYIAEQYSLNTREEVELVRWIDLVGLAQEMKKTQPTYAQIDHEASMHGFMEKCIDGLETAPNPKLDKTQAQLIEALLQGKLQL